MRVTKQNIAIVLILFATCFMYCAKINTLAGTGGGTETTNGIIITGTVVDTSGELISGASIQLRSINYTADPSGENCASDTCYDFGSDENGGFSFEVPDSILYCITISDGADLLSFDTLSVDTALEAVHLGTVQLNRSRTIEGTVVSESGISVANQEVTMFGIERVARIESDRFIMEHMPRSAVKLHSKIVSNTDTLEIEIDVSGEQDSLRTLVDTIYAAGIDSGLISRWEVRSDGKENFLRNTIADSLGGSIEGAQIVSGRVGNGLLFDGVDDIVTIADSFAVPDQGTIAFWFKAAPVATGSGTYRILSSSSSSFEISLSSGFLKNELCAGDLGTLVDTVRIIPDTWYHAACTWDIVSNSSQIYINGKLSSQGQNADDPIEFVSLTLGNSTIHSRPFAGILNEMRVYDRLLTPIQVASLASGAY